MLLVTDTKRACGADLQGTADDPHFEELELGVVDMLCDETGRNLDALAERVETLNSNGSQRIYVRGPIRTVDADGDPAVPTVEVRSSPDCDWEELEATDIEWEDGGDWILRRASCFPRGLRCVRVTYQSGYTLATATDPSDAPRRVQALVRQVVAARHLSRNVEGSVQPPQLRDLPDTARATIESMRSEAFV